MTDIETIRASRIGQETAEIPRALPDKRSRMEIYGFRPIANVEVGCLNKENKKLLLKTYSTALSR